MSYPLFKALLIVITVLSAGIGLFFLLANIAYAARYQHDLKRAMARQQDNWRHRPKIRLTRIGRLTGDGETSLIHPSFTTTEFEGYSDAVYPVPTYQVGPDGKIVWGGWSDDELRELVLRRKEFEL